MSEPNYKALVERFNSLVARNTSNVDEETLRELYAAYDDLLDPRHVQREDGTPYVVDSAFGEAIPFMHIQKDIVCMKLERMGKSITDEPSKGKRKASSPDISEHGDAKRLCKSPCVSVSSSVSSPSTRELESEVSSPSMMSISTPPPPPGPSHQISTTLTDLLLHQTANLRRIQQEYNESIHAVQQARERHARAAKRMAEARQQVNETARRMIEEGPMSAP